MRRAAALLGLLVAACGSPYPMTYSRPGASPDELRMDAAQCRVIARSSSAAERDALISLAMAEANYRDCMIGRGWLPTK